MTEAPQVPYFEDVSSQRKNAVAAGMLHDQTAAVLARVADGDEDIIVTERGKPVAAIVPVWKLEMIRRIEDSLDAEDARVAREEVQRLGSVPHADVKARLDL